MPHVISLQETRLRSTQTDSEVSIAGYTIFRRNRIDDKHGGVLTYVMLDLIFVQQLSITVSHLRLMRQFGLGFLVTKELSMSQMFTIHLQMIVQSSTTLQKILS